MIGNNNHVNWREITYVYSILNQLSLELNDLEKLLPTTRRKRGLLDLGGQALKFLFGTATNSELQTLHLAVEEIKNKQTALVHSVENQVTYMKEFDEDVKQNTKDVSTLARTLKSLVYDVLKLNITLTHVEQEYSTRIQEIMNVSQIVREL